MFIKGFPNKYKLAWLLTFLIEIEFSYYLRCQLPVITIDVTNNLFPKLPTYHIIYRTVPLASIASLPCTICGFPMLTNTFQNSYYPLVQIWRFYITKYPYFKTYYDHIELRFWTDGQGKFYDLYQTHACLYSQRALPVANSSSLVSNQSISSLPFKTFKLLL